MNVTMDNQQANTYFKIGWITGILEGEGWFILNRQLLPSGNYRYVPVIGMNNTSEEVVQRYANILKEWDIGIWIGKRKFLETKNKDQWITNVRGFQRCKKFISVIKPYLQHKIRQLELLEEYIEHRNGLGKDDPCGAYEESIFKKVQELNRKGKASTT